MVLMPKRTKFRKVHRNKFFGTAHSGNKLSFGDYGLQAVECGSISNREIESARVAINRSLGKKGKIWIRIFPDIPVTKKPLEVRMGKGKGNLEGWFCKILFSRILFEVQGCTRTVAQSAFCRAAAKLNLKTRFVDREESTTGDKNEE